MKKRNLNKKLTLNKTTVTQLDRSELDAVKGGAEITYTITCIGVCPSTPPTTYTFTICGDICDPIFKENK